MHLLNRRTRFGFDRIDGAVLALYSGMVAWTIAHHEPWSDEAQAWLLARDCSLTDLLFHRMHYEGTPGLWHVMLWALTRLHIPFAGLNWVAGAFAVLGIFVLLRYAPLPRIFRVTIPFTFFLAYQYAVVARSYVMFPLLLFVLSVLYTAKRPRLVPFALVAGVFANLSTHALVLAICFALLYTWEVVGRRRVEGNALWQRSDGAAGLLLAGLLGFAAIVGLPAPDVGFAVQNKTSIGPVHAALTRFMRPETLPPGAPPLDPLLPPEAGTPPPMNAFGHAISDEFHNVSGPHLPRALLGMTMIILSSATFPISESNLLACVFLGLAVLWFWSRRSLPLLLPYAALLCFLGVIWVWVHHTGLSVLTLLAAAWMAADRPQIRGPRWIEPAFASVSLVVIALQIGWTIYAVADDTGHLYDPGHAAHDFLVSHYPNAHMASYIYDTTAIQPYSDHNLFLNQPHSFWVWSSGINTDQRRTETLAQRPDLIVVADFGIGDQVILNQWLPLFPEGEHTGHPYIAYWEDHGYHEMHRFCGRHPFRFGASNVVCDVILEPNSQVGVSR